MGYLQLTLVALVAVAATAVFFILEQRTGFGKLKYSVRQIIIGIVFGGISVLGSELGSDIGGAVLNVRDVAPLSAGLVFGGPAGIIAGVIGGLERYFAVNWGAGAFTAEACCIATIFAGLLAFFFRRVMFDNKRPTWFIGPLLALVTEVVHMLMVFVIHYDNPRDAFGVVEQVAVPMIILIMIGVFLSLFVVNLLSGERLFLPKSETRLAQTFQRRLIVCVLIGFVVTTGFVFSFQNGVSDMETDSLLIQGIVDVKSSISEAADDQVLQETRAVATDLNMIDKSEYNEYISKITPVYGFTDINVVGRDGIISHSSNPEFVGYDMNSGPQSAYFMSIINDGEKEMVQGYQPISYDGNIYRKYAAVAIKGGGFVQVGYDASHFQEKIREIVWRTAHNRHIGENGFIVICDEDLELFSDDTGIRYDATETHEKINIIDINKLHEKETMTRFTATIFDTQYFVMYDVEEGFYIFALRPEAEARFGRNLTSYLTFFMEVIIFMAFFVMIFILLKRMVVKNMNRVNETLGKITEGELDEVVDVRSNLEFSLLSDEINTTVDALKMFIAQANERFKKELEYAQNIQYSSLPHIFPPFPDRKEFDIHATMNTAKEVGGDFYDFYFVGPDKLAFLIADVSGKGIPAALFMMKAKTIIKNLASTGMDVAEVFEKSNNLLCEDNEAEMFVTAWLGLLDLKTGDMEYVNAGHNPPLLWRAANPGSGMEYVQGKRSLVLAGMEDIPYKTNTLKLEPGDLIFLYTDGVTEATDANNELYGEDRLAEYLSARPDLESVSTEAVCVGVKADVDAFVKEADQFDDITMLCLRFNK